ncbi:MAG: metal ABC transporter permease [candidate division KSB1 bacterium]|nr:metal ABC transporter permease [candidate division KSB1 bacterium]
MVEIFGLPFMQFALIASVIIGTLCAFLGVYIVLKRMVFFSAAVAQVSTAGMALAFLLGLNPTFISLLVTMLAVLLFALRPSSEKIPPDSLLGISYVGAFALGILFIAKAAQGAEELQHLLQGNILTITPGQIYLLLVTFVIVGIIHLLFYRQFIFIAYDPAMAQTQGYHVTGWNLLLYFTLGLVISLGIKISGVLLIFSFLVMPAVTGLLVARKMRHIFLVAILSSLMSVVSGLYFSFQLDLPSGPTIVAVMLGLLLVAFGLRKK